MGPFSNALAHGLQRGANRAMMGPTRPVVTPVRPFMPRSTSQPGNPGNFVDWFQRMQRPEWQEWLRRMAGGQGAGDTSYMMPGRTMQAGPGMINPGALGAIRQQYRHNLAPNAGSAKGGPYRPKF
jgi:hypothetical protein